MSVPLDTFLTARLDVQSFATTTDSVAAKTEFFFVFLPCAPKTQTITPHIRESKTNELILFNNQGSLVDKGIHCSRHIHMLLWDSARFRAQPISLFVPEPIHSTL